MRASPSNAAYFLSILSAELLVASSVLCIGCRVLPSAYPLLFSNYQYDWTLLRLPLAFKVRMRVPRLTPLNGGLVSSKHGSALTIYWRLLSAFFLLLALYPRTWRSVLSCCCPYYWVTRSIIKCLNSLFCWEALLLSRIFISVV